MQKKFKIKKNDNVEVLAGKDKGKRGVKYRSKKIRSIGCVLE